MNCRESQPFRNWIGSEYLSFSRNPSKQGTRGAFLRFNVQRSTFNLENARRRSGRGTKALQRLGFAAFWGFANNLTVSEVIVSRSKWRFVAFGQ